MIVSYVEKDRRLIAFADAAAPNLGPDQARWVDLINPTADEIARIEQAYGINVPTAEEMKEIEVSSRLYQDGASHVMTARIVYRIDEPDPITSDITFILTPQRLVTVRFATPRGFVLFANQAAAGDVPCTTPTEILVGIIDAIVEREADLIERVQSEIEATSKRIFDFDTAAFSRAKRHAQTLTDIGKASIISSRTRESLVSLSRLLTYLLQMTGGAKKEATARQRIKAALQDVQSLAAHVDHVSGQIAFLMEATVGLVGIEQNQIIKLFSVVAVMLMPPTLIASVYGMNFTHMPELQYPWAYPATLVGMVVSAVVPFAYFKQKGWL